MCVATAFEWRFEPSSTSGTVPMTEPTWCTMRTASSFVEMNTGRWVVSAHMLGRALPKRGTFV